MIYYLDLDIIYASILFYLSIRFDLELYLIGPVPDSKGHHLCVCVSCLNARVRKGCCLLLR